MNPLTSQIYRQSLGIRDDEYLHGIPSLLDAATLKRLSEISPLRSTLHIALEWALIVVAIVYGCNLAPVYVYPLLLCFIGARQHALVVLMHEGAHVRLFSHRKLNDWVSEVLLSWPMLLFTMHAYRRNHWPHHRHTNGAGDPDWARKQTVEWRFPKSAKALWLQLMSYTLGAGFLRFVVVAARLPKPVGTQDSDPRAMKIARLLFLGTSIALITALHVWREFLLFWVLPFLTWFQVAFLVRSIAEHFAIEGRGGVFAKTRTTIPNWFDSLFLVPKNAGYHLEHHLFPSVPFFNLPRLHALLMARPEYRDAAHITHGYWNVLRECVQQSPRPGEENPSERRTA